MWRWALDLCRTGRARRAAGVVISPMVEQSRRRLGEIPDVAWSDPYIVGFTAMLITMVARIETGISDGRSLCRIQTKSWQDITERSDMIGEELVLLSAARNRDFEAGCRDAMTLSSPLSRSLTIERTGYFSGSVPEYLLIETSQVEPCSTPSELADLSARWEHFFDARVALYTRPAI